jgi:hypothetical protein
MSRARLSTTVDADLLADARRVRSGLSGAALVDEALQALMVRHRSAEVDASYAAYDEHPLDEPGSDPVPRRSVVNLDAVESVSVAVLVQRLGRLADSRMRLVCAALVVAVDCAGRRPVCSDDGRGDDQPRHHGVQPVVVAGRDHHNQRQKQVQGA